MRLTDQDELIHNIMHAAQQQSGTPFYTVAAHVASYDPRTNMVRCLIPSIIDPLTNEMRLTGWLQLYTPMMGNGWGMQYAPFGGATQENLQAGEQVHLIVVDHEDASYECMAYTWNAQQVVPNPNIKPGELYISDPYGNVVYLQSGGTVLVSGGTNVVVSGAQNVQVYGNDVNVTAQDVNVTADNINLGSQGETLQYLVTQAMQTLFNEHTHPAPNGTTGVPNQQMSNDQLTSVVKAG